VAAISDEELEALREDDGIIRNRLKIHSARKNAVTFLAMQQEFGSFDAWRWRHVDGKPSPADLTSIQPIKCRD